MSEQSNSLNRLTEIATGGVDSVWENFREGILEKFHKHKNKIMIGVFGYYPAKYENGRTGKDVIDFLSKEFCLRDFFVINGDKILYTKYSRFVGKRIVHESGMHNDLKDVGAYRNGWGWSKVSRIFASVPPNAVFMLTKEGGTDFDELVEFCENKFDDKKCGIGFIVIDKSPAKNCKHLEEIDVKSNHFYCPSDQLILCKEAAEKGNCIFTSGKYGGISAGGKIQKFVKEKFMCLCTIIDYKQIPNATIDILRKRFVHTT